MGCYTGKNIALTIIKIV